MNERGALPERLARAIALAGPLPVSRYMAAANAEYYATQFAIGAEGDFVTAPEISQMFGELIGAWIANLCARASQNDAAFVELGPGRGTLAADARRAWRASGLDLPLHFIEASPRLRREQATRVPDAVWHDGLVDLPGDRPLIIVANEFFDALPIEQAVRGIDGWHRRLVASQGTLFVPIAGPALPAAVVPPHLRDAPPGSVVESAPAGVAVVDALARRLAVQGGAMLIIDYGYEGPALGETLQAVRAHAFTNPFDAPGSVDLSAHVDFAVLGAAAARAGAIVYGPVAQRDFLGQLGLAARAAKLASCSPDAADAVAVAHHRLTDPGAMGVLFRAMALTGNGWPMPAGFA